MDDQHRDKKVKLNSGAAGDAHGNAQGSFMIRWKWPKNGSLRNPFRLTDLQSGLLKITPPVVLPKGFQVSEVLDAIEATEAPAAPAVMKTKLGDLICQYCRVTFENKDLLLSHRMRTPHGYNDQGQIVTVSAGLGLDNQAKIIAPPAGYYIDDYSNILKIPTPPRSNPRPQTGPPVVNPPPFFEPGCPATGVFLPVGTPGYMHPTKLHTLWFCPWDGCGKRNWKIWRVNRHINCVHVAVRKAYLICSCGQAYATKPEEEAHRAATGHDKAI